MSEQLGPKKSLLKFKPAVTTQQITKAPILHKSVIQQKVIEAKQAQTVQNSIASDIKQNQIEKTEAEKAFDLIKKHRIIHKMGDKAKTSNK